METYRICIEKYSTGLNASGKQRRWNFEGQFVIYTGSSRSLSTLELIVYRKYIKPDVNYKVMVVSIADEDDLVTSLHTKDLPENWRTPEAYSNLQEIGSKWYRGKKTLVLKVPFAVIPKEYNYVINTNHKDFSKKVHLVRTEDFFWDKRLF
ncbi:hypothetical protein BH10BAC5_BH10BAC5_27580 [soil metagenome]